jgi:hypothetical protein
MENERQPAFSILNSPFSIYSVTATDGLRLCVGKVGGYTEIVTD